MSLVLTENSLKSIVFEKSLPAFVILADETPFRAFIINNILNVNQTFFGLSNSFGNLIKLLPTKELYFEN